MYQALIIEDQKEVRDFIRNYYKDKDIELIEAWNGQEGLEKLNDHIDIVYLDIMMPGIDGYETCKLIRQQSQVPIIFISALSEDENQLTAYQLGGDDYVTKPFKPSLLYAKSIALLKRLAPNNYSQIKIGELILDINNHNLLIDNQIIRLSNKEFQLLHYLSKKPNQVLNREQIIHDVWGYDYLGNGRAVDTYIKRLRNIMKNYPYIVTVHHVGYILEVECHEIL